VVLKKFISLWFVQRYEIIANFARMVEAKSIETLSVSFTAGVIAGTGLSAAGPALPLTLLSLLLLPLVFRHRMIRLPSAGSVTVMALTFLLLGMFCAWNGAQAGIPLLSPLEDAATRSADALRNFIDSLPFGQKETAPLLKALLTGDRSGLSPETVAAFRGSGASHILALSGLHMGVIYLIFDKLAPLIGQSRTARRLRYAAILTGAAFFTLMTGAGPSIVRAFLFIAIRETLRLTGRPCRPVKVLALALLVQLVMDPGVIRSLGFQLSYLAMAGILLLYPILERWYPESARWDPFRRIWKMAALSISCQVFTAPLAWLRFHSFPTYFLLTNLLALPLTSALMGTSLLTLGLEAIGFCPSLLFTATDFLARLLLWILTVIASM
jgi:competence protein ComEC